MATFRKVIPVYTSRGDVGGYLSYPNIYNTLGEWIGWVTVDRKVYSVLGHYVGYMTNDPRILRKISDSFDQPRLSPPTRPLSIAIPATVPLAPMMAELTQGTMDVLGDAPELLPSTDAGELREDLD